jgi:hypothetical protein
MRKEGKGEAYEGYRSSRVQKGRKEGGRTKNILHATSTPPIE